jgi:hypothetical protein
VPKYWTRLLGTSLSDYATSVAIDATGNVFVSGLLESGYSAPPPDGFFAKYDAAGNQIWLKTIGDSRISSALDADDNLVISYRGEYGQAETG